MLNEKKSRKVVYCIIFYLKFLKWQNLEIENTLLSHRVKDVSGTGEKKSVYEDKKQEDRSCGVGSIPYCYDYGGRFTKLYS